MVRVTGQVFLDSKVTPRILSLTKTGVVADLDGLCIYGDTEDVLRFAIALKDGILAAVAGRGAQLAKQAAKAQPEDPLWQT